MPHNIDLVTTVAVSLGLAMILGYLATRMKLPPIVGYLLAGILIGPATPGFVANVDLARQLAEIGVMLLMFGVGLHFSMDDLLAVRKIAIPGALAQMFAAAGLGFALALLWGWTPGAAVVFGLALSVASTVVVLRALEAAGALGSMNARIAIGWLVVEDLAMILALVLLPPLAGALGGDAGDGVTGRELWLTLLATLGKASAFVVFMVVIGRRVLPRVLFLVARTGSRELFTLCVIATAVSVAYGASALFDVSFALGAFFAGMMMGESELSRRAAEQSLPLRDAFAVLFFVSVGMLFDPQILVDEPMKVLSTLMIVMLGTPLVAMALVVALRYPLNTALTVGASLSQIGEFSFILAALGVSLGLMPAQGQSLVIAAAILSIAVNPLVFAAVRPAQRWLRKHSRLASRLERSDDPLAELPMSTGGFKCFISGQRGILDSLRGQLELHCCARGSHNGPPGRNALRGAALCHLVTAGQCPLSIRFGVVRLSHQVTSEGTIEHLKCVHRVALLGCVAGSTVPDFPVGWSPRGINHWPRLITFEHFNWHRAQGFTEWPHDPVKVIRLHYPLPDFSVATGASLPYERDGFEHS